MADFDRITYDPLIMGAKACIRGMRVTVAMILRQMVSGRTVEELLADCPYLEREDILRTLRYTASQLAMGRGK
jgi:uncharacterized protein (DUF433 family)